MNFYPESPLDPGNVPSKALEEVFCSITEPQCMTLLQRPVDTPTVPPHRPSGFSQCPRPRRPLSTLLAPQFLKTSLRMMMKRSVCSGGAPGPWTCSSAATRPACWPPHPAGECPGPALCPDLGYLGLALPHYLGDSGS